MKEVLHGTVLGLIFLLVTAYMLIGMVPYYALLGVSVILVPFFLKDMFFVNYISLGFIFILLTIVISYWGVHMSVSNAYIGNMLMGVIISYYIISYRFRIEILKVVFVCIGLYLVGKMYSNIGSVFYVNQEMFEGTHSSVNYVSVLMIGLLVIIYLIELRQNKKISLWPSLFCLVVSAFSMCRSGIFCILFIAIYVMTLSLKVSKKYIYGISLFGCFVYIYLSNNIDDIFFFNDILENKGEYNYVENSRYVLLNAYLKQLDFEKVFFGQDLTRISAIRYFSGNPHNTFVLFLANWGFLALCFFTFIIYSLFWYFKHERPLFWFLVILLLRSWFDTIFSGLIWDFVLYTFIAYPFLYKKKRYKHALDKSYNNRLK